MQRSFTGCRRQRAGCLHRGAPATRGSIRARAINTPGTHLAHMSSSYHKLFRIAYPETFSQYLAVIGTRLPLYDLPLGASLDATPDDNVVLQVPKVSLLDLYVFPTSRLHIEHSSPNAIDIRAMETTIKGSHHINSMKLDDCFELKLHVHMQADGDVLSAKANFRLDVDVPFPFNVTPTPALEAAGNAAVDRILAELMDVLSKSIVRDHIKWAKEQRAAVPA